MKKLPVLSIMLLIVVTVGWGLYAKPTVVVTHAVLGEFTEVVGGDLIEVTTIIPSGFCPSHYDLRPSDIAAVSNASLVIYSGFEPWMESLLASVGDASHPAQAVQLPGSWNRPDDAAAKVDAIVAALTELLPEEAAIFEENATAYKEDLAFLAATLKEEADHLDVKSIPVIAMAWQATFVSWLGFDVVATYGVPETLSLRDLVDLAQVGTEKGALLVIDNLQSGVNFGAKLAREIGALHVVLTNFPGAMPGTETVPAMFKANAASLFSALEPVR